MLEMHGTFATTFMMKIAIEFIIFVLSHIDEVIFMVEDALYLVCDGSIK